MQVISKLCSVCEVNSFRARAQCADEELNYQSGTTVIFSVTYYLYLHSAISFTVDVIFYK